MLVCVALFELHIEYAQSLKDKRQVVRSIRDKLRNAFHCSCNEVAFQDVHERARLAISFIADSKQSRPDKPWYMWYCPGANHAPHHAPQE